MPLPGLPAGIWRRRRFRCNCASKVIRVHERLPAPSFYAKRDGLPAQARVLPPSAVPGLPAARMPRAHRQLSESTPRVWMTQAGFARASKSSCRTRSRGITSTRQYRSSTNISQTCARRRSRNAGDAKHNIRILSIGSKRVFGLSQIRALRPQRTNPQPQAGLTVSEYLTRIAIKSPVVSFNLLD